MAATQTPYGNDHECITVAKTLKKYSANSIEVKWSAKNNFCQFVLLIMELLLIFLGYFSFGKIVDGGNRAAATYCVMLAE